MDLGVSLILMGMMLAPTPALPTIPSAGIVGLPVPAGLAANSISGIDVVALVFTVPNMAPQIPGEDCRDPDGCSSGGDCPRKECAEDTPTYECTGSNFLRFCTTTSTSCTTHNC